MRTGRRGRLAFRRQPTSLRSFLRQSGLRLCRRFGPLECGAFAPGGTTLTAAIFDALVVTAFVFPVVGLSMLFLCNGGVAGVVVFPCGFP